MGNVDRFAVQATCGNPRSVRISTGAGVPSMFDSLEVKVLCPRSGGDEGLARRKGGAREGPSERSAEAKPRPDGQKPNTRQFWSDEQARICEVPYPSRPEL